MPSVRDVLHGPWRAVPVLGVTQIIAWGSIFYSPVLTMPLIAAERGWSLSFAMGGFSLGLLVAGLASPFVGSMIDRHGGHVMMTAGSLVSALGLVALVHAEQPAAYLAVWMLLGLGLAASLYDPAFATLGRIFGAAARRPITVLTLAGGFASTVGWPSTHFLIGTVGWRGTYLVYAVLLALICAPLHAFALPRSRAASGPAADGGTAKPVAVLPPYGLAFLLVAAAFASYAFVPSALSAHLLAIFGRSGIDAATVVLIGALFGPAQVAARLTEFVFGRDLHPLVLVRFAVALLVMAFAMLAVFGISTPLAAAFALMFGAANGLVTIARGAVPLALFGPAGYGRLIGRIAGPSLLIQAAAPLVLAFIAERISDPAALACAAAFAVIALMCFTAIRRPRV
jgi:predicted MFS family arabinose efflux permease